MSTRYRVLQHATVRTVFKTRARKPLRRTPLNTTHASLSILTSLSLVLQTLFKSVPSKKKADERERARDGAVFVKCQGTCEQDASHADRHRGGGPKARFTCGQPKARFTYLRDPSLPSAFLHARAQKGMQSILPYFFFVFFVKNPRTCLSYP